ncbi:Reverse transcriptase (RNA-dependent DNA polymerase) [Popillia japonica]|uniref:Reverse transcriptase (RNA-dependent DNA polymerase) n=1 Tax=Popillia japonica TaxID=7064 RepID=A0AAW1ICG4_POPJA
MDNLVSSLTGSNVDALDYLKYVPKPVNSFCLLSVTNIEVSHAISTLSCSKSSDIYGINSDIVRNTRDFLIDPLVYLINLSFRTGRYIRAFKNSKVVPIFKKGDPAEPKNYRPISVVCILGKIIEIILKERLLGYFKRFSLLHASQFGYMSERSTIDAVLRVVEGIVEGMERGEYVMLAMRDLSKAFDCVSHGILWNPWRCFGLGGVVLI